LIFLKFLTKEALDCYEWSCFLRIFFKDHLRSGGL
jgi:hypothetical protein